ncbi:response regulator transcription factor [Candidatus Omnitrophota bacterium]
MSKKRVLVIDDEINFGLLIKLSLQEEGDFEVAIAGDGKTGLRMAKEIKPHLILLDILMPGLSGLEVLKRLKEDLETLSIPVAMFTAVTDHQSKVEASQLFDEDYIMKPVEMATLIVRVREILKRKGIE